MIQIEKELLVGRWNHSDWWFELTMFNYLKIGWTEGGKAFGSWFLRDNDVIFTFNYLGEEEKRTYIFSVVEVIDRNKIITLDLENNKRETFERIT